MHSCLVTSQVCTQQFPRGQRKPCLRKGLHRNLPMSPNRGATQTPIAGSMSKQSTSGIHVTEHSSWTNTDGSLVLAAVWLMIGCVQGGRPRSTGCGGPSLGDSTGHTGLCCQSPGEGAVAGEHPERVCGVMNVCPKCARRRRHIHGSKCTERCSPAGKSYLYKRNQ